MIVQVKPHEIIVNKSPVNELEVNVTKIQFEFDETIPSNYVKKAFFTNGNISKVIELATNECDIPNEVLQNRGQVRLGVIAYEVQDDTLIERFNPRPGYFAVLEGSMVEADNTEPITPTDKEQVEQMLSNINIDGEKEGRITTITITFKDGTTKELQLEDGKSIEYNWRGTELGIRQEGESSYQYVNLKGETGQPGAIKLLIVEQLPEVGSGDTLYFVPKEDPETQDLYDEYMYVDNDWERLGEKQIVIDLTDYVKNTDYATAQKGGVVKANMAGFNISSSGIPSANVYNYTNYVNTSDGSFVGKGTLENVITGKGLINNQVNNLANYYTKTEIDNTIGNINSALDLLNGEVI